ncbi:ligand-binding sensor domain-containing protein [Spirosoma litoris]
MLRSVAAQTSNLPLEFQHIQETQGLSYNMINCLFEDRDGYLWIGTYSGLNRFDGSHFTIFKADRDRATSLGNNIVQDICEDKEGNLWLATDDGISQYSRRTGQFRNIRTVGAQILGQCLNILCDRTGQIWFSTARTGLFRLDPKTNQFWHLSYQQAKVTSLSSNDITKNGLLEDPSHNGLWITTEEGGLNYLNIPSGEFINYRNNPNQLPIFQNNNTSALAIDGSDRLIFADNTDQRIQFYDLVKKTITKQLSLTSQTGRSTFPMGTIVVDHRHHLWVSSWTYTMFTIEPEQDKVQEFFHDVANKTSISGDFFWTAWPQKDGTIWIGTVNGISYTNPEKTFYQIHNLAQKHPTLAKEWGLSSFLEDENGSWWLVSTDNELFNYEPSSGKLTVHKMAPTPWSDYRFGLPQLVSGLNQNEFFICRTRSVLVFNKRSRRFSSLALPPMLFSHADDFRALVRQGDLLWLFGASDAIFSYHLPSGRWRTYGLPFGKAKLNIWSAGLDRKGRLWADVADKGFIWFSAKEQRFVSVPPQPAATAFSDHFAFTTDRQNRIWTPISGKGLVEFDPQLNTYRTWTEQDGLYTNECKAAYADPYGQIWMAAFNKFSIINPARRSVQNISLQLNESNIGYVDYMFPLRNGNILTTLKNYVVEFMPRRVQNQSTHANVLISSLILPDTSIVVHANSPSLALDVFRNNFSINYSILNRSYQPYTYLYTLEGYDDHWVKADARTVANYTKIPGGDYLFRVKALVGATETREATLAIHVDTAFYNTHWFRVGLVGLVLALLYLFYRNHVRETAQLHHFQIQTTRLERDKAQIQYQNLINHLNPHFLFNSLTSLNSLIITKPKEASVFLRKLSVIYRYILQNKDKELVSLQDELAFAQNYIDLQKARFGDELQISINIEAACLSRMIVPVTIQNLIENAIKHNILDEETPLYIQIYTEENTLFVRNYLQRKDFVETSNKQGLASLKSLYNYLSGRELNVNETSTHFQVAIPLL